jgi:hypothetical protein
MIIKGGCDDYGRGVRCISAAVSAIRKILALEPDDPIVLVGADGLGLPAIAMLRALGHQNDYQCRYQR